MTPPLPYTFYACPCTEDTPAFTSNTNGNTEDESELERTFNPHDPRSTYSLHTLDNLLFCDDCYQIRCAQCVSEEIVQYYCPNCLFEVPGSSAKNDGNRCSRNCYSCPSCTSPLTVSLLDQDGDPLKSEEGTEEDTYILSCQYCSWSSLDIDLRFDKPTKITDQLKKARKAILDRHEATNERMVADKRHEKLTAFYKEQLIASGEVPSGLGYSSYGSPANLSRIINLYGGLSHNALKKTQEKPAPMREATAEEGLIVYDAEESPDDHIARKISEIGWHGTTSRSHRHAAPMNFDARMISDLWPIPIHLKTRRGKRCRQCRQFVFRPDPRTSSSRPRLRVIAINHIPRLSLRPLSNTHQKIDHSFFLKNEQPPNPPLLQPHVPQHFILTLRNPIFETVRVTLATSATTPGKVPSRVTILCPSFTIGPAGDVWDEALSGSTPGQSDGSRKAAMASLTGGNEGDRQPEAGKVWEQTRNSTSVVLEIVPGALSTRPSIVSDETKTGTSIEEGDEVLEVPVYVRVEWTAEVAVEGEQKAATERVNKELAYWCVLGVGRIAS